MERAGLKAANSAKFQLWQPDSNPQELITLQMAHQKLDYTHNNPVETGFVKLPEDWKYSSAVNYNGGKGLLEIIQLDPMII